MSYTSKSSNKGALLCYTYLYRSQLLYIIGGLVVSLVICTGLNVYGIGGKIRGKFFSTDRKEDRKSKYNSKENGRTLIAVDEIWEKRD